MNIVNKLLKSPPFAIPNTTYTIVNDRKGVGGINKLFLRKSKTNINAVIPVIHSIHKAVGT